MSEKTYSFEEVYDFLMLGARTSSAHWEHSNERMARLEQKLEAFIDASRTMHEASDQRLTRIEHLVKTENNFKDQQEMNRRLANIERVVSAIAQHFGITS